MSKSNSSLIFFSQKRCEQSSPITKKFFSHRCALSIFCVIFLLVIFSPYIWEESRHCLRQSEPPAHEETCAGPSGTEGFTPSRWGTFNHQAAPASAVLAPYASQFHFLQKCVWVVFSLLLGGPIITKNTQ